MRGGLERWKRGVGSQGVRQALAYAFQGSCDSHVRSATGIEALAGYGDVDAGGVTRFTVARGAITSDRLDEMQLRRWVDGRDPDTDEQRGRDLTSPDADLILDGTINAPKSYSIAALLSPDVAEEFESLQDRLRDRIITTWQRELNARRGAGGRFREALQRVEVVELRHARSRALDPHLHRHLWLNIKVMGQDGKWSNVDSRVAMKLHTVINAEGELAARTDPAWIAALARHGYTLDETGEIAQLAHAVRPLSRRSNQIERNRAMLLSAWRQDNLGLEPSPAVLQQIDRRAWATDRPNKPSEVDEKAWQELIRSELEEIDPQLLVPRGATSLMAVNPESLNLGLLAARALVEADERAAGTGARFSRLDIQAGATRALAASGVVQDRRALQATLDEIVLLALAATVTLLPGETDCPDHIKGFMASATAGAKAKLAAKFDELTQAGAPVDERTIAATANDVLPSTVSMDEQQVEAAAAISGTDRLVSITGPAGAGKTTMLRVAKSALAREGRVMFVVAPTKKAASVAGREIGTAAASLHALLADHGWRWRKNDAGAEVWQRLTFGDVDPKTGITYTGPRRFPVTEGDRIVIDEAGMVDLHAANALAVVAADTGAGIAMVGDDLQAMPVGHRGAMACMRRRSSAVIELTAVHRFADAEYAALTLRMREPSSNNVAREVAAELAERGLIHRVGDQVEARDVMVEAYLRSVTTHRRVALVTGTNEEADSINEIIQQRRVDQGHLSLARIGIGQGEQRILEGDIVQTRRNDRHADVENRAIWVVRRITGAGLDLVSVADGGEARAVSHDYAAEHVHLAYASTVHGIQGETTDASIVGPGVDASGLYVGMTRGRERNEVIVIARTDAAAAEAVAGSLLRGTAEVSIEDSIVAASSELGRAARPVQPAPGIHPEVWNDRTRRPFGRVAEIERVIAAGRQREHELHQRLDRIAAWMHATKRILLALDARVGALLSAKHGRPVSPEMTVHESEAEVRLRERYAVRTHEHEQLIEAFGAQACTSDELAAEVAVRASLRGNIRAHEDEARASVAATGPGHMARSTPDSLRR